MLELKNISYSVEEDGVVKDILKNISVTIDDKFVAITGPNGGGKSTLAKIIAGILTPTEGRIILDGEDITDLSITERAKGGISFAFQQPVRFKGITVKDLIQLAAGRMRIFVGSRAVRQGLCKPRSQCFSFRRRIETYRDRHDHCQTDQAFRV